MIVGFTGTPRGMTAAQKQSLRRELAKVAVTEGHHGDCIGADAEFHELLRELYPRAVVVIHPPENDAKRAFCRGDVVKPELPYLVRNKAIVEVCEVLFACPGTKHEMLRSGTWATIRRAKKAERGLVLVYPDGTLSA